MSGDLTGKFNYSSLIRTLKDNGVQNATLAANVIPRAIFFFLSGMILFWKELFFTAACFGFFRESEYAELILLNFIEFPNR